MATPVKGARCSACNHPDVLEINRLRSEGMSIRRVGAAFGLNRNVIARHFGDRHPGTPLSATSPDSEDDFQPPATAREALERIRDELQRRVATGRARTDEIRELRMTLETLAKLGGEDVPREVTVRDVRGLSRLFSDLFQALLPYPDALEAARKAVDRWQLGQGEQLPEEGDE